MKDNFTQIENSNYIINRFGKELWIQVYGHRNFNGADGYLWTCLIPNYHIEDSLKNSDWESNPGCDSPGFVRYGRDVIKYDRYSGSKYEPLIFLRDFHGIKEPYIEISEEFRLLNNLYFDYRENKYYEVVESGELEPVIKIEDNNVFIRLNHLKRFAAVKQMGVALYFDIRFCSPNTHKEMDLMTFSDSFSGSDCIFDIYSGDYDHAIGGMKSYSIIHGKKILFGVDVEQCGYWPYDREKEFEDFIIGIDEDGTEVKFNSNPENLSNYFGANPSAPHYLTPVYFTKDVLAKYYSKPELYVVSDGCIRCQGLWLLRIDNLNKGYVSVYLGDLGRDLPHKEQTYWKSFNIIPDGNVSEAKFRRDFLAEFANPEIADLKFKQSFVSLRKKWNEKFNWDLFLELTENDKYNFEHLRIPVSESQVEFDGLVLSLVKTIIDSLNESKLNTLLTNTDNLKGSIARLERYFEEQQITDYESHIKFLRNLQDLRSTGSGHRKGKSYEKASVRFGLEGGNFVDVFERIFLQAIDFIEFLEEKFIN